MRKFLESDKIAKGKELLPMPVKRAREDKEGSGRIEGVSARRNSSVAQGRAAEALKEVARRDNEAAAGREKRRKRKGE